MTDKESGQGTVIHIPSLAEEWPVGAAEKLRIEARCHTSEITQLIGELIQQATTMPVASRFSRTRAPYESGGGPPKGFMSHGETEAAFKRRQILSDLVHLQNEIVLLIGQLGDVALDMLATRTENDGSPALSADDGRLQS
jgi:hypothetical protein